MAGKYRDTPYVPKKHKKVTRTKHTNKNER